MYVVTLTLVYVLISEFCGVKIVTINSVLFVFLRHKYLYVYLSV